MIFSLSQWHHPSIRNSTQEPRSHSPLQEHLTGLPSPINSVPKYLDAVSPLSPFLVARL